VSQKFAHSVLAQFEHIGKNHDLLLAADVTKGSSTHLANTFNNKKTQLRIVRQIISISITKLYQPGDAKKSNTEDTFLFVHCKFKCSSTVKSFVNIFSRRLFQFLAGITFKNKHN
jgi:hypothetical protein